MEINKLYNLDCNELIRRLPTDFINGVLTSPPYNIERKYSDYGDNKERNDFINWQVSLFNELNRVMKKNSVIVYNFSYGAGDPMLPIDLISEINKQTDYTLVDQISWKKPNTTPISTNRLSRIVELIYILVRKNEVDTYITNRKETTKNKFSPAYNYIEATNNDGIDTPFNSAVYSTELVLKLLKIYFKPGSLILDPFSGIGTTIRGCMIGGYNYIGSELGWRQTNYFNNKRLHAIQKKLPLLKEYYSNILNNN